MRRRAIATSLVGFAGALVLAGCPGDAKPYRPGVVADSGWRDGQAFKPPPGSADGAVPGGDGSVGPVPDGAAPRADGPPGTTEKPRQCQRTCKTPDDCCEKPPCTTYPDRFSCTKGYCRDEGCSGDPDCAGQPDTKCLTVKGQKVCAEPCSASVPCKTFPGDTCVENAYCSAFTPADSPPCSATQACPKEAVVGKCYLAAKICGCSDSPACQAAFGGTGGTWVCAEL